MDATVEPTRRAFCAAVQMEIHAACSSTTKTKAAVLDEEFPAYDDMLEALRKIERVLSDMDMDLRAINARGEALEAIAKAEGHTDA